MSPWTRSLIAVAVISALPLLGMAVLARGESVLSRNLSKLVPFAIGALLGAPLFHLVPEAMAKATGTGATLGWIAAGAMVFFVLDLVLHGRVGHNEVAGMGTPAAVAAPGAQAARMQGLLPLLIAGDALHNGIDGMLIATAYLDEPTLGVVTGMAVALHELPRELGTFALLVGAGMSVRRAMGFNVATAGIAAISALLTLVGGVGVVSSSGVLLAVAAGNFLYLGGALAVEEARRHHTRRELVLVLALVAVGVMLTAAGAHRHQG
jgi:zinc and cadmium transporter